MLVRHPNLARFLGVCLAPHLDLVFGAVSGHTLHVLLHGPESREVRVAVYHPVGWAMHAVSFSACLLSVCLSVCISVCLSASCCFSC